VRRRSEHGRRSSLAGATALVAILAAGCGSSGPPGRLTVPRGGFANDKADPATMQWFKAHRLSISALGSLPTLTPSAQPDYSALSAQCLAFGDAVTAAKKLPPIPNADAETLWKGALGQFAAAATNCSNGAVSQSATLLSAASSDLALGHNTLATLVFGPPSNGAK
jgi:hypothetical protein